MDLDSLIIKIRDYEPELINIIFDFVFVEVNDYKKCKCIIIPDDKNMDQKLFYQNNYLKMIILNNDIQIVNDMSFKNCLNLQDIIFSKNLEIIRSNSFEGCKSIYKIDLPKSLKYIGYKSFYGCKSLKEIFLHKEIKYIGYNCFDKCSSLKRVYISKNTDYFKDTFPENTDIIKY